MATITHTIQAQCGSAEEYSNALAHLAAYKTATGVPEVVYESANEETLTVSYTLQFENVVGGGQ